MSALAARTNASLSRLSHVISKLERRGWVSRCRSDVSRRVTMVTMTEEGYAVLVAAAPGHVETVRVADLRRASTTTDVADLQADDPHPRAHRVLRPPLHLLTRPAVCDRPNRSGYARSWLLPDVRTWARRCRGVHVDHVRRRVAPHRPARQVLAAPPRGHGPQGRGRRSARRASCGRGGVADDYSRQRRWARSSHGRRAVVGSVRRAVQTMLALCIGASTAVPRACSLSPRWCRSPSGGDRECGGRLAGAGPGRGIGACPALYVLIVGQDPGTTSSATSG